MLSFVESGVVWRRGESTPGGRFAKLREQCPQLSLDVLIARANEEPQPRLHSFSSRLLEAGFDSPSVDRLERHEKLYGLGEVASFGSAVRGVWSEPELRRLAKVKRRIASRSRQRLAKDAS